MQGFINIGQTPIISQSENTSTAHSQNLHTDTHQIYLPANSPSGSSPGINDPISFGQMPVTGLSENINTQIQLSQSLIPKQPLERPSEPTGPWALSPFESTADAIYYLSCFNVLELPTADDFLHMIATPPSSVENRNYHDVSILLYRQYKSLLDKRPQVYAEEMRAIHERLGLEIVKFYVARIKSRITDMISTMSTLEMSGNHSMPSTPFICADPQPPSPMSIGSLSEKIRKRRKRSPVATSDTPESVSSPSPLQTAIKIPKKRGRKSAAEKQRMAEEALRNREPDALKIRINLTKIGYSFKNR